MVDLNLFEGQSLYFGLQSKGMCVINESEGERHGSEDTLDSSSQSLEYSFLTLRRTRR